MTMHNIPITPVVSIAGANVNKILYRGEPVVTFAMVDLLHQRPEGTAKRNFNDHRERFVEGEHFVLVPASQKDEFRTFGFDVPNRGMIVLTRRGYLKLVKPMTDDRAWQVQDEMIDRYFEVEARAPAIPQTMVEALRAAADALERAEVAERTKAEIGSRREATAMNTASQAVKTVNRLQVELDRSHQYATVKRMTMLYHGQNFDWRMLKRVSLEIGLEPIDVFDQNYGTVKAYHADAWRKAYALEIPAGGADV